MIYDTGLTFKYDVAHYDPQILKYCMHISFLLFLSTLFSIIV